MSFDTILIANRGEIARRIIRAARAMGLRTVATYVASDGDSPHVTEADEAERLATSYLDGAALIEAALRAGAGALHPGYGFLSENATFAHDVTEAGLVWIGPPARVIAAMGDKLAAKEIARAAGVAVLDSFDGGALPSDLTYPLLVKATAGGGGKGMRIVRNPEEVEELVAAARREAAHGFGDDRVFLERYVPRARHVEVQILADHHGQFVHFGERECSIQRRHQKLIEESPSSALSSDERSAICEAALRVARSVSYESLGTVEFLLDDESKEFFFLEVNTRLQVEHPVTEAVTGVDLVREQIRVAAGEALGYDQNSVSFHGHAIEVRLCAEDPVAGFLPATGELVAFDVAAEPKVRWDSAVELGSRVTVDFDPLLAKVIAHGTSRGEVAATLALALERLHLGGVRTNRDFLAATLRHRNFLLGETTTDFIERFRPPLTQTLTEEELRDAVTAAALWLQGESRADAPVLADAPSGWRNGRLPHQRRTLRYGDESRTVEYRRDRLGEFDLGDGSHTRLHAWNRSTIDVEIDGRRSQRRVTRAGDRLYVQARRGTVELDVVALLPPPGRDALAGGLSAPMPGAVLDVRVTAGQRVSRGDALVVLEAMKMEHVISAPYEGVVTQVFVTVSQQVERGTTLLALESDGADQGPS